MLKLGCMSLRFDLKQFIERAYQLGETEQP